MNSIFIEIHLDIKEKVTRAFHHILRREPDDEGLEFWTKEIESNRIRIDQLDEILKNSEEYNKILQSKKPIDLSNPPKKLNLGCGFDKKKGYLNVDFQEFHKPDLVADIKDLSMLPTEYFEEIIAQDVLEHFPRNETIKVLKKWSTLLKKDGILKLRVPNLIGLLSLFLEERFQNIEGQNQLVNNLYGTQAYFGDWHYTGFTKIILDNFLENAGFGNVKYQDKDEWLYEITARKN